MNELRFGRGLLHDLVWDQACDTCRSQNALCERKNLDLCSETNVHTVKWLDKGIRLHCEEVEERPSSY